LQILFGDGRRNSAYQFSLQTRKKASDFYV